MLNWFILSFSLCLRRNLLGLEPGSAAMVSTQENGPQRIRSKTVPGNSFSGGATMLNEESSALTWRRTAWVDHATVTFLDSFRQTCLCMDPDYGATSIQSMQVSSSAVPSPGDERRLAMPPLGSGDDGPFADTPSAHVPEGHNALYGSFAVN